MQADAAALLRLRGSHPRGFRELPAGGAVFDVTDAELDQLQRDPSLLHISGDLPVHAGMAVTNKVTAAETLWQGTKGLLGLLATPGDTGKGIGVADSGFGHRAHTALDSRVIAHVNLVSTEPAVRATRSATALTWRASSAATRQRPRWSRRRIRAAARQRASLIDVRVLGSDGDGLTSDVIAGIDWAIANRARYNIRVINLSLGHPVTEPSTTDPLCQAVARAVTAGIVVVASAGNYGTSARAPGARRHYLSGKFAAGDHCGSDRHVRDALDADDRVAPYSSRGPTPFEMAVKPDVVAPGTKLVSLEVPGSYLTRAFPQWHIAGTGKNAYMRLSGTSMAAAVVSGGVALLLNAQPSMSPAQVKIALQMGARYMPDGGLIGSGAGCVNFAQSLTISNGGLVTSLLNTVTSVLGLSSGAAFRDRGTLIDRVVRSDGAAPASPSRSSGPARVGGRRRMGRSEPARPDESAGLVAAQPPRLGRGGRLVQQLLRHLGERHPIALRPVRDLGQQRLFGSELRDLGQRVDGRHALT